MKKLILTLSLTLAVCAASFAQVSNVLYSSSRIPQITAVNPAFFPSNNKIFIALPALNMQLQSPLSYNNIFGYDSTSQQYVVDLNTIIDTLASNGDMNLDANIYGAGFGLKFGRGFITASAQAKVATHLGIPQGLLTFLNDGNYNNRGETLTLVDGSLLKAQVYTEYSIGYGREITDNLTIGARAKLLNGLVDAQTAGSSLSLYTSEDLSSIQATLATNVQYSTCVTKDENGNMNVLPITENWGWAFDLGARYQWGMFDFSASVLDLGKGIHWTQNVYNIVPKDGENNVFEFSGLDLTQLIQGGSLDTNLTSQLKDSIMSMLDYETIEGGDYWTSVPTKLNAAVMVNPISMVRAGILFHGELDRYISADDAINKLRSNTTLLGNVNLNDWLEVMLSASVVGDGNKVDWFNPGFGVNVSLFKCFQVYGMVDYISNMRMVEAKKLNATIGLNLLFGNGKKKTE